MMENVIKMKPKMLGIMLDCSRNAVMTLEHLKSYATLIRTMGYNTMMLYTEDTYELEGNPYFGHFRGRYTRQELQELDDYCCDLGLELVPCIQTLAHLEGMFQWESIYDAINDCADILLIDEEMTYRLIDAMFAAAAQCFRSRKIHVGMDEAHRVGSGKYRELHGNQDRVSLILHHLDLVAEIAEKYGFEIMIWSDMLQKAVLNPTYQAGGTGRKSICEEKPMPQNVTLVYWDYYTTDPELYRRRIQANQMFGRKVYYAGGAMCWGSFAPDNALSIQAMQAASTAFRDCELDGVLITLWGDDGSDCSKLAPLPAVFYAAQVFCGNNDLTVIQEQFQQLVGLSFEDWMVLDRFDKPGGKHKHNVSKYLLYNDPFMGIYDARCSLEDGLFYCSLAEQLRNTCWGNFTMLRDTYVALAQVLALKAPLGIRTRQIYNSGDRDAIDNLIDDYADLHQRLTDFYQIYRRLWYMENKPQGFEVQTIRLGGLMQRIADCRERLMAYQQGDLTSIPELEESVLEEVNGPGYWAHIVTANIVEPRRG